MPMRPSFLSTGKPWVVMSESRHLYNETFTARHRIIPQARTVGMMVDHVDFELLPRIRHGDAAALATLLDRYWKPVVRYVAGFLGGMDAAEDAAQEAFVRLWERRETLKPTGSVRGLLFRMARNAALDERRRRAARERADIRGPEVPVSSPADDIENAELSEIVADAVRALPERRRDVFLLVRHQGLSYKEVSQVLDLAPQTVANHLSMALADLRTALAPHFYGRSHPTPAPAADSAEHRSA
jgi:RNA polymerase sigma-70 factor (family 1)